MPTRRGRRAKRSSHPTQSRRRARHPQELRAAIERQIAGARPGHAAASTSAAALAAELATGETDSPTLGLAKAVARQCVCQVGGAKAAPAIEYARALAAGVDPSAQRSGAWRKPATPRVLGAAPRR